MAYVRGIYMYEEEEDEYDDYGEEAY